MKKVSISYRIFSAVNALLLAGLALICVFPILHILAVSLSGQAAAAANEVVLWPVDFTFASYASVVKRSAYWTAFGVSIKRVVLGVTVNTVLTALMAYPLSKYPGEFKARRYYVWFLMFAMIFNGGLVPTYMLIKDLHLLNSIWALVLPGAVPIYNVILTMNFIRQLPREIEEAAFIDGASYFQCFLKMILPLSKPVLATIILFSFLGHWNAWFDGMIYMENSANYPLQTYMYNIIANRDITNSTEAIENALTNIKTLKSAQLFLTMLPILAIYPFLQKYFTKGITVGAVKG